MNKLSVYILICMILIFIQSCNKIFSCEDPGLGFSRRENQSRKLRLDGYYYEVFSKNPEIYLLNENGVFFYRNSFDSADAQTGNVDLATDEIFKQHKNYWGVYKIENSSLEIHSWFPRYGSCSGRLVNKGIILTDTTFEITYSEATWKDKSENVSALFGFVPYSPKPDSVVSFIP